MFTEIDIRYACVRVESPIKWKNGLCRCNKVKCQVLTIRKPEKVI